MSQIKTGDSVRHTASEETYLVAYVEGGYLVPCGWPLGEVKVSECELIEVCSPEEEVQLLRELVKIRPENGRPDPRAEHALRRLVGLGIEGFKLPCPYCRHPEGPGRLDESGEQYRWCCDSAELAETKKALLEIADAFDEHLMVTSREILDKALNRREIMLCTDP